MESYLVASKLAPSSALKNILFFSNVPNSSAEISLKTSVNSFMRIYGKFHKQTCLRFPSMKVLDLNRLMSPQWLKAWKESISKVHIRWLTRCCLFSNFTLSDFTRTLIHISYHAKDVAASQVLWSLNNQTFCPNIANQSNSQLNIFTDFTGICNSC